MSVLPAQFADLEPYARIWCLPTETQRWRRRLDSPMPELVAFYDAFFPRLEAAIEHCDSYPLDELPEDATHLLWLIYSLVMVAMAVEIFHQPAPTDSADAELERIKEPLP